MSKPVTSVTSAIKSRLSIVNIVKRYVDLRQMGNRWVAPCPFHQETQPSFSVNEEEGFFYCFGCQAAGDIFDFYAKVNGIDFKESLSQLAEEAGVSLQDVKPNPKVSAEKELKKSTLSMYSLASEHYQSNLRSSSGKACMDYLESRKISSDIIESFSLGYSLPGWRNLGDFLGRHGYSGKQCIDSGLLAPNDQHNGYDRFRGRLMFPIKNLNGQIIAFGGRIIDNTDSAKYINSTDSILYKKGDNIYGLYQARRTISAKKFVLLTEGYMDVLTLHQFGYTNACGVLGTALTKEQVHKLSGFSSQVELIFDGDAPGKKAALRACEMFLAKGLKCKVIIIPDQLDIDDFLKSKGVEAFEKLREFAPDGLDFCIRTLSSEFAIKDSLAWVKNFISSVEQPEIVSHYLSRLSHGLDLDEREIRMSINKDFGYSNNTTKASSSKPKSISVKKDALDREILKFIIRFPHHCLKLEEVGVRLAFTADWSRNLWDKVLSFAPSFNVEEIFLNLTQEEKEFWVQNKVTNILPSKNELEELDDICAVISNLCVQNQVNACIQALKHGSGSGDYDMELLKALNNSLINKRNIGRTHE